MARAFRVPSCAVARRGAIAAALLAALCLPRGAWGQGAFPFKTKVPAPSLEGGVGWLNTPAPLDPQALRGKFVLLDFWTYCCINCMHILPELKKLERAYPNNLVVVGVHSAKFANERVTENIREAIRGYGIEHPIVNDADRVLWTKFQVSVWPSLRLIDPAGNLVYATSGEVTFEELNETIKKALPYYRRNKLLDETPLVFDYERMQAEPTPLSHPGKILADEAGGRLFVSDTSHNRVVVCSLEGELLEVIGSGAIGRTDGGYAQAEFDHPQGLALHGETLYVADTENHLLRKVDLREKQVATVAGTGKQRRTPKQWADPGRRSLGNPARQTLNSPWALCIAGDWLYVAMAGAHQVWRMSLDEKRLELHAGSGTEDIVDGALTGRGKVSCFAQPSGLASDGDWLYVADSEGSSLRAVPFAVDGKVQTVVGTANLPAEARLFTFGGSDGGPGQARFQHPLDVAWHEGKLYVADTYNNKIRVVDLALATAGTFAGEFEPGKGDAPPHFNEPGGLSIAGGKLYVADTNNHVVRVLDLVGPANGPARSTTLKIVGLDPPNPPILVKPRFGNSKRIKASAARVRSHEGKVVLRVEIDLPLGAKLNEAEPGQYWLEAEGEAGPLDRSAFGRLLPWTGTESTFDIPLPAPGEGSEKLELSVSVLYCGTDNLCRSQNLVWSLPLQVSPDAESNVATLSYRLD